MGCECSAQARLSSSGPRHTRPLNRQCASISKERYQRSATSDQEAREKQIPPLRGPTRHKAALNRKSGRFGPFGFAQGRRDDRGGRRDDGGEKSGPPQKATPTQTMNCQLWTASYRPAFPRDPQKRRRAAALQERPSQKAARGLRPTGFPSILNVPLS